jgi:hypothetical protein
MIRNTKDKRASTSTKNPTHRAKRQSAKISTTEQQIGGENNNNNNSNKTPSDASFRKVGGKPVKTRKHDTSLASTFERECVFGVWVPIKLDFLLVDICQYFLLLTFSVFCLTFDLVAQPDGHEFLPLDLFSLGRQNVHQRLDRFFKCTYLCGVGKHSRNTHGQITQGDKDREMN